jgi:chemotaxis protein histidine kinase CheA
MIGEILAVNEEKFHHFIDSASGFVSENERIIRKHDQADHSAIAELFRNMHTIKGNARTYNLQHLTNVVHETEQRYDELRRAESEHHWDQQVLMDELARVREAIDSYAKINELSLGRKRLARRAGTDRYLMVDKEHITHSLKLLETANTGDMHELVTMHDALHRTLRVLGTESVAETLSGVLDSLPSLAQELGKEVPHVRIDDNGYRLRGQAGNTMKNVFMHLLRNSVDHGIETAAQRIALGKPAAGVIDIEVGIDKAALQLTLSDDGRGLALKKIRDNAIERGWIDAHTQVSDEEIAEFIFRAGFSTAEQVTEVSGRGVGMDAVRDFLKREHGSIELRFTDDRKGAEFRQFQTIVCLPDSLAVDSLGADVRGDVANTLPVGGQLAS